jgi:hypothetical protein
LPIIAPFPFAGADPAVRFESGAAVCFMQGDATKSNETRHLDILSDVACIKMHHNASFCITFSIFLPPLGQIDALCIDPRPAEPRLVAQAATPCPSLKMWATSIFMYVNMIE